ncbi:MAG: thioredoxin family protein [Bacteroidales bacterium]|nr:thioredoxin family protein [Bacteroidales bacterium]
MKKFIFLTLAFPIIMGACQQKNTKTVEPTDPVAVETAQTTTPDPAATEVEEATQEDLTGKVITLTARDFREKIIDIDPNQGYRYKGQMPCVVDFYANWCRPCMGFKPIFHKLSEQYKGKIIFYQIDVDKAQDICSIFNIESIPTFIFFDKGAQPLKMVGAPTEQEMVKAIDDFLAQ